MSNNKNNNVTDEEILYAAEKGDYSFIENLFKNGKGKQVLNAKVIHLSFNTLNKLL